MSELFGVDKPVRNKFGILESLAGSRTVQGTFAGAHREIGQFVLQMGSYRRNNAMRALAAHAKTLCLVLH